MAKLFAEVVIAGNYRKLAQATKGANAQMKGMAKQSQRMSSIMKASIAGIGFAQLTSQLIQATKAADEDRRSMALLNKQLDTSWKANDKTKQSVDEFITSMMLMSGVADDELRPAYAKIASQTKSMSKANKMFSLAMDIAADRGVSLEVATKAVTKAMAGNENAFNRLYPAAKDSGDAIAYVTAKSKGAAKIAGDNSPFARLTVQFDEMKETIGKELLPYVDELSKWMQSTEGQQTIKETTKALIELLKQAVALAKWALDNKEAIIAIAVALKGWQIGSAVLNTWKTLAGIWKGMKVPSVPAGGVGLPQGPTAPGGKAPVATAPKGGAVPKGVAPVTAPVAVAAAAATAVAVYGAGMVDLYNKDQKKYGEEVKSQVERARKYSSNGYFSATELLTGGASGVKKGAAYNPGAGGSNMAAIPAAKPANVKITINAPNVSGTAVIDALKKTAKSKGVQLGKMLLT